MLGKQLKSGLMIRICLADHLSYVRRISRGSDCATLTLPSLPLDVFLRHARLASPCLVSFNVDHLVPFVKLLGSCVRLDGREPRRGFRTKDLKPVVITIFNVVLHSRNIQRNTSQRARTDASVQRPTYIDAQGNPTHLPSFQRRRRLRNSK